jgi:hypothetical protein
MSADAAREITQQKLHRSRVRDATHVESVWMSDRTTLMWERMRSKNAHKVKNPNYDNMALSLKLHNNVINLDAMKRQERRHKDLMSNVKGGVDTKETDRIKAYREHRKKMRVAKLLQQEFHMQELAVDLRKLPADKAAKKKLRDLSIAPTTAAAHTGALDFSPPRLGEGLTKQDSFELEKDRVKMVSSDFNPYETKQLKDDDYLMPQYTKYAPLPMASFQALYDSVISEINPLVTAEDIELEKRRDWDPTAPLFSQEEEEEKQATRLEHIQRMLNSFLERQGGLPDLSGLEGEEEKKEPDNHSGEREWDDEDVYFDDSEQYYDDGSASVLLDSPRLRKMRPYLTTSECKLVYGEEFDEQRRQERELFESRRLAGENISIIEEEESNAGTSLDMSREASPFPIRGGIFKTLADDIDEDEDYDDDGF